jgi:hypothetical protein
MNSLLHITKDEEIRDVDCATEAEVIGFFELTGDAPTLDPMRPFLDKNKANIWNNELFELFVPYFEEEENIKLTEADYDIVEKMFFDRLERLGRKWREFSKLSAETASERKKKSQKLARANTRRVGVRNNNDNVKL